MYSLMDIIAYMVGTFSVYCATFIVRFVCGVIVCVFCVDVCIVCFF